MINEIKHGLGNDMTKYEIQTRGPHARDWSNACIGEPNEFDSVAEAEATIEELNRLTGEGWRESEYRVVAITDAALISVGDAVEAGQPDTEDYDTGIVHAIDGDMAEVGWKSGQRTKTPIADLRHVS